MSTEIRIHPTGYEEHIEEDRPVLLVTPGYGNNAGELEVHLEWSDLGNLLAQGWFRISDLQLIIDTYKNGKPQ